MIVVTKWICSHPAYKVPEKQQQTISCFSVKTDKMFPSKPAALFELEIEQNEQKLEENKIRMTDRHGETVIVHYKTIDDDLSQYHDNQELDEQRETLNPKAIKFQSIKPEQPSAPQSQNPLEQQSSIGDPTMYHQTGTGDPLRQQSISDEAQITMINSFLSGQECLTGGGNGWWKYEICFNKHVIQYHMDEQTKKRIIISLGEWHLADHITWLQDFPHKRPLADTNQRQTVSFLYSRGQYCELTKRQRQVEVKFKCLLTKGAAVTIYLVEPVECEYLLALESPWFCGFVNSADKLTGLPRIEESGLPSNMEKDTP
jgi:endoplasmic reticulum lectin 1